MLYRAAQSLALVEARQFVTPDDIQRLAIPVWSHRLIEKTAGGGPGRSRTEQVLREILDPVPVPV